MDINELFFVGLNKYGQAGIGQKHHNKNFTSPKSFAFSIFIKQISCGAHHSALLTIEGNVYTMGSNIHGALGSNPSLNYSFVPTLIEGLDEVTKIECGPFHMCAISGGQLYSWGKGIDGQLGHGNTKNQPRPLKIESLGKDVQNVSCGTNHTLVLLGGSKKDSTRAAYAFGNGIYGQLGSGQSRNSYVPVRVKLQNVQLIAAGQNHSLFVNDGKVYSCGDNSNGQLGAFFSKKFMTDPTNLELSRTKQRVIMIQAKRYSLALTESGGMYVWGIRANFAPLLVQNVSGDQNNVIDIRVGLDQIYGLTTNGSLYSWEVGKGIEKEGAWRCKEEAVVCNSRAILDFSVGDGFVLVLGDIVKQIPYSSVPPPLLSCFDEFSSSSVSNQNSADSKTEEEMSNEEESHLFQQFKENLQAESKDNGYGSIDQSKEGFQAEVQQIIDSGNRDFFKLKSGRNAEKKGTNLSSSIEGLYQNFNFNNIMQTLGKRQKRAQKLQGGNYSREVMKIMEREQAEQDCQDLAKTPSSSILCEPSNFLKQSITKQNDENRKATINQSISDQQSGVKQPTYSQQIRKKKYSYSYLHEKQMIEPSVSSKEFRQDRQQSKQRKIDQIMQMLQKSNSLGNRQSVEHLEGSQVEECGGKQNQVLKSNRLLRVELRDKELKISQLQELLSRKEMEIETQRELIKLLRIKNSSNFASMQKS